MQYISTRGFDAAFTAAQAIQQGLAPDGGLFLPDQLPFFTMEEIRFLSDLSYAERAAFVLSRFLTDYSYDELLSYTRQAYASFDAPLKVLTNTVSVLELYHGPTCAFKDFALQLLPYLLTGALKKTGEERTIVILTATSGDTGKAALEGFADVPGTRIAVFFPQGGTSAIQRMQMTTQAGENVVVFAVEGNFDDAQTGVKRLFSDPALREELAQKGFLFSSANSINWGRLAPQIAYYFSAYCDLASSGRIAFGDAVNIDVPTGNFGNILAAYLASCCGLPVHRFLCASNSNQVLTDLIRTGTYDAARPFYTTASPSMDILISSNLERLLYLLSDRDPSIVRGYMDSLAETGKYTLESGAFSALSERFYGGCADDAMTFETIRKVYEDSGYLLDTHTAVGWNVYEQYASETGDTTPTILAATADPFKFPASVLKALGAAVPEDDFAQLHALETCTGRKAPAALASLEEKEERFQSSVAPAAMKAAITHWLTE
ncbi:MAG: threonine synthase [Clostridiales bacterium]|nr:threonine synthase [Clostridiales bacterium]